MKPACNLCAKPGAVEPSESARELAVNLGAAVISLDMAAFMIEAYTAQCVKEAREKLVNSILLNIGNLLPSERGNWDKLEGAVNAAMEATK